MRPPRTGFEEIKSPNVPGQWAANLSTICNHWGFRYPTENANFSRTFLLLSESL
jgi:hypothetical protein